MQFSGKVIKGDQYGRQIGYPTANLSSDDYLAKKLDLRHGIYAGSVTIPGDETAYPAAVVISEPEGQLKLEAHLLDFKADLYGNDLTVTLLEFVRPYEAYNDESELITAIAEDVVKIRMLLGIYHD